MNRPIWTGRRPVDGVCGEVQDIVQAAHGAFVAWSCGTGTRFARPRQPCSRRRVRGASNLLQPLRFWQNKAQLLGAFPAAVLFTGSYPQLGLAEPARSGAGRADIRALCVCSLLLSLDAGAKVPVMCLG